MSEHSAVAQLPVQVFIGVHMVALRQAVVGNPGGGTFSPMATELKRNRFLSSPRSSRIHRCKTILSRPMFSVLKQYV